MTPQDISNKITDCLTQGYIERTNKDKVTEAIEELLPLLGYIPEMKRRADYEYSVACSDGVANSQGAERIRIKLADGYAAQQKAELEEVKSLEKSLHTAISALQSLLKEYD